MINLIEEAYACGKCEEAGEVYDLGGGNLTCRHSFKEMRKLVEDSQAGEFHNHPGKGRLSNKEQRRHSAIALERLFSKSEK